MVVYKAARRINGFYHSLYVNAVGLDLMYRLNRTTQPPDPTQLFGCLTEGDARSIAYSASGDVVVLKGTAGTVEAPSPSFRIMSIGTPLVDAIAFWKALRDFGSHYAAQSHVPTGTVLLSDFRPTAVIQA